MENNQLATLLKIISILIVASGLSINLWGQQSTEMVIVVFPNGIEFTVPSGMKVDGTPSGSEFKRISTNESIVRTTSPIIIFASDSSDTVGLRKDVTAHIDFLDCAAVRCDDSFYDSAILNSTGPELKNYVRSDMRVWDRSMIEWMGANDSKLAGFPGKCVVYSWTDATKLIWITRSCSYSFGKSRFFNYVITFPEKARNLVEHQVEEFEKSIKVPSSIGSKVGVSQRDKPER